MAEKPILFNSEMVKAILGGRKTQTRRLVKGLPLAEPWFTVEDGKPMMCDENGEWYPAERFSAVQPGDILWVRETWNGGRLFGQKGNGYIYAADYQGQSAFGWRPSIHMPKEAARIFLRVKDVRMERLQGISHEDILREGIAECKGREHGEDCACAEIAFSELWDSTIKKADLPRYSWEANPWVWVIEFERQEGVC